ncbi:hypothetical protein A2U01_0028943 [Trifolium medium]|uniref:Uncharacterized protein n=1 Tax=Trifolium medium TaxID=97028 RepID=A0A392P7W1_9FABA|nr:hypothetical protein [Trifolium medium]
MTLCRFCHLNLKSRGDKVNSKVNQIHPSTANQVKGRRKRRGRCPRPKPLFNGNSKNGEKIKTGRRSPTRSFCGLLSSTRTSSSTQSLSRACMNPAKLNAGRSPRHGVPHKLTVFSRRISSTQFSPRNACNC